MQTRFDRFAPLLGRRDLLRIGGGLAVSGMALPSLAPAQQTRKTQARSCIFIYLLGGPPHLDMFDLKPEAPVEIRGPFRPISTVVPGLKICEHLPKLATMANRFSLVRSVSHNNHNHTPMIYYTLTGREVAQPGVDNDVRPPERGDYPHLGAVLSKFKPSPRGIPGYIAIPELAVRSSIKGEFKRVRQLLRGGGSGILGPLFDPLCVNGEPGTTEAIPALSLPKDILAARMDRRAALLSELDHLGPKSSSSDTHAELRGQAIALTGATGGAVSAFSIVSEPPAVRDRYGSGRFAAALVLARRLAEIGTPMIAIHFNEMTVCDGWDTHSKNFPALESELLPMVDRGLSALITDLEERQILDETLIVVMGEFGRTPKINSNGGRDHWGLCQFVLFAGGGIRTGQVIGASDRIGAYPTSDPVDPIDVHATLFHCMGLDPEQVYYDSLNRPHPISTGRVIKALV